eukprot:CAMPEP_0168552362 /NCGR_PEP_ID=MMETSP0413-20121227/6674_1 /TAXON_ID=136452 /ORGANISM="Filamoeba nolandi, Strain NC-AS-23-1" /LENGTH=843 /DNA_ID=CAMNT_0008582967 /DNA_START=113 /DNA_END=2644 /DNA_ORIENTATION=-
MLINSTKTVYVSKSGFYSDLNNTVQFSSLTSSNNSFMHGSSSGIVFQGPIRLQTSSVPFLYVLPDELGTPPSLDISNGSFPITTLPSGLEWDPAVNGVSPSNVYITSMKYQVSVRENTGSSGTVYTDAASELSFQAAGPCDEAFQKCSVTLWRVANSCPVLLEDLKLATTGNYNVTNIQCTQDAFLWNAASSPGFFMYPFTYTIRVNGSVTRVNSTVNGIPTHNFTLYLGSADTATVNVTSSNYSTIALTSLNFDLSGQPQSEEILYMNATEFTFDSTSAGSYRIKVYDANGCLSWIIINVDGVFAPSPTPTPSVVLVLSPIPSTPTPSSSPSSIPSSASSSSASPPANSNSGTNKSVLVGALVGAIFGTLAVAAGISVAVFFLISKRRRNVDIAPSTPKHKDQDYGASVELKNTVNDSTTNYSRTSKQSGNYARADWDIRYSEIVVGTELGRGAFGVVYKCRWRNTDCVVKQLDLNKKDDHYIQQFLKEANNVRNLRSHPNVCTIFGVCTDPQYPICIVMEYLPDGSLDHLVYQDQSSQFKIDWESFFDFAKDIASGMSHLHAENILHCDLACRNLLLAAKPSSKSSNKWTIKIADFGLSRITADEYSASNDATFPIRWSAPETLKANRVSRASDVFSFGVVLWEIAEGKRPWIGLSNQAVVDAVVHRGERLSAPTRLRLPAEVWNLVLYCWHANPSDRPSFNQIYERLLQIEQSCLEDRAKKGKQTQDSPQVKNTSTSANSTGSNSANYSNNNNYGSTLQKLTNNVSVDSTDSAGQTTSIELPEPAVVNSQPAQEENYTAMTRQHQEQQPTISQNTNNEYLNYQQVQRQEEYLNVPSTKKK